MRGIFDDHAEAIRIIENAFDCVPPGSANPRLEEAAVIATCLSDAGLLLPDGGRQETEWRCTYENGGYRMVWGLANDVEQVWEFFAMARDEHKRNPWVEARFVTTWADGYRLEGPWRRVATREERPHALGEEAPHTAAAASVQSP